MFKFVAFAMLSCAAFMLSEADPITELNRYLKKAATSRDFNDNIQALKMVNSPNELDGKHELISELSSEAKRLAGLVSKLSPIDNEDTCGKPNIEILRDSIDSLPSDERRLSAKLLASEQPLRHLLKGYTHAVGDKCLKSFDNDIRVLLGNYAENENKMKYLDYIYGQYAANGKHNFDSLMEAQNLPLDEKQAQNNKLSDKIYPTISIMHNGGGDLLKRIVEVNYWNDFLIKPCEEFLKDEPVQDILRRTVDLGVLIWKIDDNKDFIVRDDLLKWASRASTCEWVRLPVVKAMNPAVSNSEKS